MSGKKDRDEEDEMSETVQPENLTKMFTCSWVWVSGLLKTFRLDEQVLCDSETRESEFIMCLSLRLLCSSSSRQQQVDDVEDDVSRLPDTVGSYHSESSLT